MTIGIFIFYKNICQYGDYLFILVLENQNDLLKSN